MTTPDALDPEAVEIASAAFARSWRFIEHDPLLRGHEPARLKAELARVIVALAHDHPDPLRLANRAIGRLRESKLTQVARPRPEQRPPLGAMLLRTVRVRYQATATGPRLASRNRPEAAQP